MTDFFDDLERELRRAHRRDTERHARSRVFDLRRLPGLPAAGRRTLVALAVVVALVAVVLAVARESASNGWRRRRSPARLRPRGSWVRPEHWWKAPIVDEPIPQEIASRFAIFRDHPRPAASCRATSATSGRPRSCTGAR